MKTRVRDIVEQGNRLFEKRRPMLSLWQTMAENFYPMRADFTRPRQAGEEFASHLMTGKPVLAHRDLGNALSSMLRPRGQTWFHARTDDEAINADARCKQFLDSLSEAMRRLMYDKRAQFVRATKQGDHDFVAFGQTVIEPLPNRDQDGILFRNHHLKDVVWCENAELEIDLLHREWKLEARQLAKVFPASVHQSVREAAKKTPYREFKCRHIVMPADDYDLAGEGGYGNKQLFPFVSIHVDCENEIVLEEVPRKRLGYVIPRWVTVSGSQYAHSPATVTALPDARMLQQITLTLLEAGQKAVDPPLKATKEAIQGGVNAFAGGLTWVDAEYDEKLGAAIEPLMDVSKGFPVGHAREDKIESLIAEAFFLNQIRMPAPDGKQRTAYEVQTLFEDYIRQALPLFEPMELEYNGGLCEETFNLGMDFGAFRSFEDMPQELRGRDVRWQFESPLQAANERAKAQAFVESTQLLATAAQIDPNVQFDFNLDTAFRDALAGVSPASWIVPREDADAARAQTAQMLGAAAAAQALAQGAQGIEAATKMGGAVETMKRAGVV
ncbi:MAG: head-tail connector protein [Pseudorhodoplanes sp.]|nr:head-tail connector protein [Pseudorhodoplanes sp.]